MPPDNLGLELCPSARRVLEVLPGAARVPRLLVDTGAGELLFDATAVELLTRGNPVICSAATGAEVERLRLVEEVAGVAPWFG